MTIKEKKKDCNAWMTLAIEHRAYEPMTAQVLAGEYCDLRNIDYVDWVLEIAEQAIYELEASCCA